MRSVHILFLFVCISTQAAENMAVKIGGDWAGVGSGDIGMRVILLDASAGVAAASITVSSDGCGGSVSGIGKLNSHIFTLTPYAKEDGGEDCAVSVSFDPSGRKGVITENSCAYYHGAACAFEGELLKR